MREVAVVGAGPAGLMAAWCLAESGHDVEVLEAGAAVGGMAGSFEVSGQRVDYGSHRLHHATPDGMLARLRFLLGEDLQTRRRNGRIRLHDRWVGFPLRVGDLARSLPPKVSASIAVDTALGPLRRARPAEDFMAEVSARTGPTVAQNFYGPYARKLYGVAPAMLDAEQARRRVAASSPLDVARRTIGGRRHRAATFLYPRTGYGTIVERLAEAATSAGAEILLRTPVEGLQPGEPTVFTASPAALLDVLERPAAPDIVAAVSSQRMRSMVLVYLVVETDRYTSFDAHYLPGPETPVARLSEPKNYRDGPDPAGRTVLCAEIPCWVGDELWTAGSAELVDLVCADLGALGLPPPHPVDVEVRRLPSVYPVYEKSTAAGRSVIRRWQRSLGGVLLLGRQGLGVPDNLHHVLAMGQDAAACIGPDGRVDDAAWSAALDRFESHVVED